MEGLTTLIIIFFIIAIIILFAKIWGKSVKKRQEAERKDFALQIAQRHVQIIEESKNILNKSKKLDTIIHRFDVILENTAKLKLLAEEHQYPDITSPPPEEIEKFYINEKDRFIKDFILEEIDKNIHKAKAVTRKSTKISILDKSIIFICDGKDAIKNKDNIEELSKKENEIKMLIDQINKEG